MDNGTGKTGSSIVTLEPYSSPNKSNRGNKPQSKKKETEVNIGKKEKFRKMEIIPGVYEIVNYEKFLILEFEGGRHENVNVFKANREIIKVCGSSPKIRPQGDGSLLIETLSPEQSQKLKSISTLDGHKVKWFFSPCF